MSTDPGIQLILMFKYYPSSSSECSLTVLLIANAMRKRSSQLFLRSLKTENRALLTRILCLA